ADLLSRWHESDSYHRYDPARWTVKSLGVGHADGSDACHRGTNGSVRVSVHGVLRVRRLHKVRSRAQGKPMGLDGNRREKISSYPAALSRRARYRVREDTAIGSLAHDRTRGCPWNYAHPIFRPVE